MLDRSLHKGYIDTFNGYGDYDAKYWLVGMEEGGGGSLEKVSRRLTRWDANGRPELLDLREHHQEGDLISFVSDSGGLQPTWSQDKPAEGGQMSACGEGYPAPQPFEWGSRGRTFESCRPDH